MESIFSADHSLTEHTSRMNSLCRLCGERVKRGEKDRNRSTQYFDEILSIFGINILKNTDHKHSSAINHQLPLKMCLGTEEQGGAAQSVNLMREHDTSLPRADAIFREKQNVTVLCMLQIRSTHNYDKVLHVLQNLNVCITGFIFLFILNVWVPFTVAVKTN